MGVLGSVMEIIMRRCALWLVLRLELNASVTAIYGVTVMNCVSEDAVDPCGLVGILLSESIM